MSKTKAAIVMAFVLALAAGAALGMLGSRSLPRHGGGESWLTNELQLSPEQQKKMNDIWTDLLKTKGHEFGDQMHALQQQREAAIAKLLSDSQKADYQRINDEFAQRGRELWKQAEQQFNAAADRTRLILTDTQRPKYDALVEKFRADGASGNWVFGPGSGPRGGSPTTRQEQ